MTEVLKLQNVSMKFGGLTALSGVDLSVQAGEIVGLIGPNGAGKTTLVNVVSGVHRASAGSIWFDRRPIEGKKPYQISRLGIARTYQIVQPFPDMTVLDNVTAAAAFAGKYNLRDAREIAFQALEFCGLKNASEALASELTLAGRKRLELAKSMATNPKVLLLDEVNAGLGPTEIDNALDLIRSLSAKGITIIIIEHLMKVVMTLCTRVVVLHHGAKIVEGPPQAVRNDPRVIEAYLGNRYAQKEAMKGTMHAS